jgi:GLPGLI family protein
MKQTLRILFFCFLTNNVIGQVRIKGNFNFPPQKYESKFLDETKQNIYYNYVYAPNPKEKEKKKSSLTVLQIGENYFKFTDHFLLKKDSLEKAFSKQEYIGSKEMNLMISIISEIGFKKDILKNFHIDSLTFQGNVHSTKYEYQEESPVLNWQLINETKIILKYKVKKAIVNYGGRKWIAWYTEEIPINLGPYVFRDLPGLILELYDDKKNFHFIATGMDNKQKEIYKRVEKKIVKTSKENFFKAERNFHEKPELFIRSTIRGGANFKKIPYNPIEIIN